ncbi:MAG: hypothetical protein WBB22_02800 [Anaerolineae bacterium]
MSPGDLIVNAETLDSRRALAAVLVVYKHRLFRDVISGVLAQNSGIAVVETTRSSENGLRLVKDLNAWRVVVIIETEARVNLERGAVASFLRAAQDDPRVRVMALTLGGSGVAIDRWQWLEDLDPGYLVGQVLRD